MPPATLRRNRPELMAKPCRLTHRPAAATKPVGYKRTKLKPGGNRPTNR